MSDPRVRELRDALDEWNSGKHPKYVAAAGHRVRQNLVPVLEDYERLVEVLRGVMPTHEHGCPYCEIVPPHREDCPFVAARAVLASLPLQRPRTCPECGSSDCDHAIPADSIPQEPAE